jgi:hypothetical protein
MMRRYIGRATGQHRGKPSWTFKPTPLFWLGTAAGTLLLAAVVVWIVNPGSDLPDEEKGPVPTSLVTPDTTTPDPSTSTSGLDGSA